MLGCVVLCCVVMCGMVGLCVVCGFCVVLCGSVWLCVVRGVWCMEYECEVLPLCVFMMITSLSI